LVTQTTGSQLSFITGWW